MAASVRAGVSVRLHPAAAAPGSVLLKWRQTECGESVLHTATSTTVS